MNFSNTKYEFNQVEINKIEITDSCWIIVYDNTTKRIVIPPMEIEDSTIQTRFDFIIKETKEGVISEINKIEGFNISLLDEIAKDIENYTSI